MKTISGHILTDVLGWKIANDFPQEIKKSIIIFAPHTSYFDGLYGKLFLNEIGIQYTIISKEELFYFPMNYAMKWYGSISTHGVKGKSVIYRASTLLKKSDNLHIIISPEGTRKNTTHWHKGFYYMASHANVPIVVAYLDYKKKEIGISGVINQTDDIDTVTQQINKMYNNVGAKYPEKFSLNGHLVN